MSIQLLLMKSGEEVIADVYEIRDKEGMPQGFVLREPQICKLLPNVEDPEKGPNVQFHNWAPLSQQRKFLVKEHAFITMCDPLNPLIEHFRERFGESDEELSSAGAQEQPDTTEPTGTD